MLLPSHFLHFKSVVCPSHLCRVRVTSPSSQSRVSNI